MTRSCQLKKKNQVKVCIFFLQICLVEFSFGSQPKDKVVKTKSNSIEKIDGGWGLGRIQIRKIPANKMMTV